MIAERLSKGDFQSNVSFGSITCFHFSAYPSSGVLKTRENVGPSIVVCTSKISRHTGEPIACAVFTGSCDFDQVVSRQDPVVVTLRNGKLATGTRIVGSRSSRHRLRFVVGSVTLD